MMANSHMKKNIKENILLSKYIPYYEEVDWINSFFKISVGNYVMESRDEFFGENISKDEVGFSARRFNPYFKSGERYLWKTSNC